MRIDGLLSGAFFLGFALPATLAFFSLGWGFYYLAAMQVRRSRLGTFVRHAITRASPSKFK